MRLELPVIPLRNTVILPHTTTPVDVGRAKSKRAVEEAMGTDRLIFLVAQRDQEVDDPTPNDLYAWGVQAVVKQAMRLPDGTLQVMVEARARALVDDYIPSQFLRARGEIVTEELPADESVVRVLIEELKESFEKYVANHKSLRLDRYQLEAVKTATDPAVLSDTIAYHATWTVAEKQEILEQSQVETRLKKVLEMLSRDLERFDMDKKVSQRVKDQMDTNQREYYLREQMKAIQKELGGGEDGGGDLDNLREKIENLGMPEAVKTKALKELDRLERMQQGSPESTVARTYLDWLVDVPWIQADPETLEIGHTRQILNEDHYGLQDVKERILEYLAVRQMTQNLEVRNKAPILVLVGPPGVGKTSLGRSIARSMNRKFHRISLGGVRDEAEIRGHRRTYIGAMPGKLIHAMKQVGVINPVILLDEIDKMSTDWRGDPASAMLEVLDPEQNNTFTDHYLDVPYDLSKVFFITTANSLQTIPRPLLDRMEIIEIPGYTNLEKSHIARGYLWPKQVKEAGMDGKVEVTDAAIARVASEYTREAGVRNLERELGKVARKAAKFWLEGAWEGIRTVDAPEVPTYLGIPKFRPDRAENEPQVGAAQGLAWTPVGGTLLTIEVAAVPGKGGLSLTGQLGDVMKESAQAALTYLRAHAQDWSLPEDFHTKYDVHVHVPEGGTPKDGPSAGITITTAIASALTRRPTRMDIAMTGEVTLRGKVLPIGGVKEKLLAAHQAGIRKIVLPKDNEPQLEDLPTEILEGLDIKLVENVGEVLRYLLLPEPVMPPVQPGGENRPQPGA
ncbi:MAG: endopeptidase La [Thermaceae bacterium]|nr:endopeptidase La [Thermaceae bacterium]